MSFTFNVKREKNFGDYKLTVLEIYMDGISEPIGLADFHTYTDMGVCLETNKLATMQAGKYMPKVRNQYGAKSIFVYGQLKYGYYGDVIESPKYPSRLGDSEFFDFETIVVLQDITFYGDLHRGKEHLPVFEDDLEYAELVKQSLQFMIQHADATTLGWIMPFQEYNRTPMISWLQSEGFERLLVEDQNWKKDDKLKSQFVILR
jgi:hypothetical protein